MPPSKLKALRTATGSALLLLGMAASAIHASGAAERAAKPKAHTVNFGGVKRVPYSPAGDPAGNNGDEKELKVRPLLIDDKVKEWTTGETHDVTDRSVAVRRALRINDSLPGDKAEHWVWQRGPWLLIDRTNGHVTALHLPDFDPSVSILAWFRDYAAYCGLSSGGKQLYAVVAQVAAKKPLLMKKISSWDLSDHSNPACAPATWQREPLQVTFAPTKAGPPVSYELMGLSAVLVEDGDESGAPD